MARASSELSLMAQWFQANKMSLNTSKTKYIIFHAPGKKVNSDVALYIDENTPNTPHDSSRVTTVDASTLSIKTITLKSSSYLASILTSTSTLTITPHNSQINSLEQTSS